MLGTIFSNDVFDYVSDQASGRVSNACWALDGADGPIQCARMFRGCLIAVAQRALKAPGALLSLLYLDFGYLYIYTSRYCYSFIPVNTTLPFNDTYIPYLLGKIPDPSVPAVFGFRAALRRAFIIPTFNGHGSGDIESTSTSDSKLPSWQGLTATQCN